MKSKLQGIWAPIPTPLTRDGSIDPGGIQKLVDFLLEGGVDGLFPLGTSGEFALLTREERREVIEKVVECAEGRVPVFAGVSDPSTENVIRFSSDAKEAGADGVIATPPYYFTTTDDGLYKHFRLLAEKIDLPLMVYNIPEWAHAFVPPEVVGRLAEGGLIVGMKYTEYNFLNLLKFIKRAGAKIAIFTGSDAMAYPCLEFGGSGAIISIANVAPEMVVKIFDDFQSGDMQSARDVQLSLLPLVEAVGIGKFPAGLKEAMKLVGVPVGGVKEPIAPLTNEELNLIEKSLREAGLPVARHR